MKIIKGIVCLFKGHDIDPDESIVTKGHHRIDEWQSCRCSECGRYDTRPYTYYFDEPNYCSYCGTRMEREEE